MSKCGVCGGTVSNTVVPHGAICDDDIMAPSINDLMKSLAEEEYEPSDKQMNPHYFSDTSKFTEGGVTYGK